MTAYVIVESYPSEVIYTVPLQDSQQDDNRNQIVVNEMIFLLKADKSQALAILRCRDIVQEIDGRDMSPIRKLNSFIYSSCTPVFSLSYLFENIV